MLAVTALPVSVNVRVQNAVKMKSAAVQQTNAVTVQAPVLIRAARQANHRPIRAAVLIRYLQVTEHLPATAITRNVLVRTVK